jgi:hypothetical protein
MRIWVVSEVQGAYRLSDERVLTMRQKEIRYNAPLDQYGYHAMQIRQKVDEWVFGYAIDLEKYLCDNDFADPGAAGL